MSGSRQEGREELDWKLAGLAGRSLLSWKVDPKSEARPESGVGGAIRLGGGQRARLPGGIGRTNPGTRCGVPFKLAPGTEVNFQQSQAHKCPAREGHTCTGFSAFPAEALPHPGQPRCTPEAIVTARPGLRTFSTRFPGLGLRIGSSWGLRRQAGTAVAPCNCHKWSHCSLRHCGLKGLPSLHCGEGAALCPHSSLWTRAPVRAESNLQAQ